VARLEADAAAYAERGVTVIIPAAVADATATVPTVVLRNSRRLGESQSGHEVRLVFA